MREHLFFAPKMVTWMLRWLLRVGRIQYDRKFSTAHLQLDNWMFIHLRNQSVFSLECARTITARQYFEFFFFCLSVGKRKFFHSTEQQNLRNHKTSEYPTAILVYGNCNRCKLDTHSLSLFLSAFYSLALCVFLYSWVKMKPLWIHICINKDFAIWKKK